MSVTRKDSKTHVIGSNQVKSYLQTCSKLVANHRPIHTKLTHIDSSNEDYSFFFVYEGYLLKGSKVSLMWT